MGFRIVTTIAWLVLLAACGACADRTPRTAPDAAAARAAGPAAAQSSSASHGPAVASGRDEAQPTKPSAIAWLMWHDIQALMGGRALYVDENGVALARIVEAPPQEVRYRGRLDQARMAELAQKLHQADFLRMEVPDRPGIPDEARSILVVRLTSGVEHRVEKWEGVEHAAFSGLIRQMRAITDVLSQRGTSERVSFDVSWRPPGPWPDPFAPPAGGP